MKNGSHHMRQFFPTLVKIGLFTPTKTEDLKEWDELAARPVLSFHHRQNPFQVDIEDEFRQRFHLSKASCLSSEYHHLDHVNYFVIQVVKYM